MNKKVLHMVAFILLVIGGLNWLLTAFGFNVVDLIFGEMSVISRVIYILVGLAAVYEILTHKSSCRLCGVSGGGAPSAGVGGDMTHG